MRIVLANKFYYRRGGDCIYTINIEECLLKKGHNVAIFAMNHPDNLQSDWSKYFPSEINFKPGLKLIETLRRPFGTKEVRSKFTQLLLDFRPDVVHLGNIHSQLSPIIAEIAHQHGIRVVWTLHDYKLLCPRYDCLRNGIELCDKCVRDINNVLLNNCMKNSMLASYIAYYEALKWSIKKLEQLTDKFICPSQFMADKLMQGGVIKEKINVLCNFIDIDKCKKDVFQKGDYYCFVGRLSHEKGLECLIEAALQLPYKLKIIGDGPLRDKLSTRIKDVDNIELLGFKQWEDIKVILGGARFMVIPSEWYENNPYSVIEALSLGTPVLGANIGGIPELIIRGVNGELFEPKQITKLKERIGYMFSADFNYSDIANKAHQTYDSNRYYEKLMQIYCEKP